MTKIPANGTRTEIEFHPDVPFTKRPKILQTYFLNGVKMYKGENGRTFLAEVFDKYFNQEAKVVMMGKFYKGENSNKKMAAML